MNVVYLTVSIDSGLDDSRRAPLDEAVRRAGGNAVWRTSEAAGRSYALLELPDECDATAIAAPRGGVVYDRPVIALALFPALPEALPPLVEALSGRGAPAGVLACRPVAGGVVVEWDPHRTQARVIMGLIDVELQRFGCGRRIELLSPLPAELVAAVAAGGLEAPQIAPERILEHRIDRA
jgi:hypothetical protein